MLNTIKNIIKEKKVFQEAAELILEDEAIDDSIILGNDDSYPEEDAEDEKSEENHEAEGDEKPTEDPTEDPLDVPIDDPSTPGETLPKPVGAQTNEPAEAGDDIILSTEIDLNTNTPNDNLPTPPINAADAVEGETDNARVDSGFEGEEEHPADDESLLDTPIDDEGEDKPAEESTTITEAISVGNQPVEEEKAADGETKGETKEEKPADEQTPKEGSEEPIEEPTEEKEEDNPVTAAVKDKVSEMNTEDEAADNGDSKEALFKKLSNLTKGIEDVKASLLKY